MFRKLRSSAAPLVTRAAAATDAGCIRKTVMAWPARAWRRGCLRPETNVKTVRGGNTRTELRGPLPRRAKEWHEVPRAGEVLRAGEVPPPARRPE